MPVTLSDFSVLNDSRFDLRAGQDHRESFRRPDGFVRGTNLAQPILMFKVKPDGATRFTISAGETPAEQEFEIGTGDNDDEQLRTLHWVISGSEFDQDVTAIDFRVATGRAAFAEVALLYQIRIDANPT